METLSAPEASNARTSSMVRTPPPTVSGMKQASAVRRTTSRMMPRFSWLAVMSRKVSSSAPAASYATAAATGSPASRRSTKFTPLTTRPSLTSRHGMTRTLNIGDPSGAGGARRARLGDQRQRRGDIQPAVVEGAPRDRARKPGGARRQQRLNVGHRGKPARGDDGSSHRIGESDGGLEIEALEQAVARNVGVDDGGDARILEAARDLERRELARLGPTFDRDQAGARVEADRDTAGKFSRRFAHQIREI